MFDIVIKGRSEGGSIFIKMHDRGIFSWKYGREYNSECKADREDSRVGCRSNKNLNYNYK